jgi:hypothetical protein
MIGRLSTILPLLAVLLCVTVARGADSTPATEPTTEPTTEPAPHKAEIPPGFHVVTSGHRSAICKPADDAWVKEVLASVAPATRPTTLPSDIEGEIQQHRKELVAAIMRDFALTDQKPIDDFLDSTLLPRLSKIEDLKPTIYYFIATRPQVADALDAGWSDPRYHLIRYAHDVEYSAVAMLTTERPMDDLVWWVEVHDGDNAATRRDRLIAEIRYFEGGVSNHISMFGQNETEHLLEQFIHDIAIKPLKLPPREDWFDFGVSNIFAIKYSAMVTGMSRSTWTEQLIGRPNEARPYVRLDLMNALDPAEIRPEYVAAYERALLPKGALVINSWLSSKGDGAVAKTLPLLRAHVPATQQEMIDTIKKATGYDVTPLLQPDYGVTSAGPH